jgi:DHA1 family multidrug resistance protein-like MFS transporter
VPSGFGRTIRRSHLNWSNNQIAVTAAAFVGFTGFTLVMPFLPLYIRELGVTDDGEIALWAGLAMGVTPAVAALCGPLWGRVADRFGNKILVQRSLVSFVVVMIAMAYVTEAWHLFALRALQGFVGGYGALTISMAAQSASRERMAQAIGAVQTAQRLGPAIGPVFGGLLAPLVGLRNAFFVSAVVYALAFVLLTVLYTEPPRVARGAAHPGGRVTFGNILALENFLLLMVVIFGFQLVDRLFGPILPLHLDQLGFPPNEVALLAGVLFSVLALAGALGNQVAGRLLARLSPRVTIAGAALVAALALVGFTMASSPWPMAFALAIVGACGGIGLTAAFTAGGSVIPTEVHGSAFGFLTGASLVGIAVSPVLSGLVGARSIRVMFGVGVGVLVTLAIVVRRVMVESSLPIEPPPAVEES